MGSELTVYANYINNLESAFTQVSTANDCDVTFKKEAQYAIQVLDNNTYIRDLAIANPQSLKNAVLNVGAIGLTLNPIEKKAYLIPRKGKICLDISYIGLVDVACQLGSISFVQAKIVHKNDTFEYRGLNLEPIHSFNAFGDRGEIVGVYCIAKATSGEFFTETMTLEDCHEIRGRSEAYKKNGSGPWKTDKTEMMKKTVIKRASKLWPKTDRSIRLETAIHALNEHEGINFKEESGVKLTDEQKNEAYEAKKAEDVADTKLKDGIISEITELSASMCKGKEADEKVKFVIENIGKRGFPYLIHLSSDKLGGILENLRDLQ